MIELINDKQEDEILDEAWKKREIIMPHIDLSDRKNLAIMRYNLQIIDERLRVIEGRMNNA